MINPSGGRKRFAGRPGGQAGVSTIDRTNKPAPPDETKRPAN